MQGVTVRTVAGYQATYAETANSADLVDRRHFNGGQQTAYQMDVHKPALVRCVTLNLVHGEPNSERRLAEQLGRGVDDRTVGRHLQAMGWRAAEAAGLSEEVAAYLEAEQQRAYWAGVAGQPLETTKSPSGIASPAQGRPSSARCPPKSSFTVFCNMYCPKALSRCATMASLVPPTVTSSRPSARNSARAPPARPSSRMTLTRTRRPIFHRPPSPGLLAACGVPPAATSCSTRPASRPSDARRHEPSGSNHKISLSPRHSQANLRCRSRSPTHWRLSSARRSFASRRLPPASSVRLSAMGHLPRYPFWEYNICQPYDVARCLA